MWNYFIPFTASLLQGKDPLQAGKDAAISGTVGDIAGNFGSALDASTAANFGSVQNATNVPSLLQSGGTSAALDPGYTGLTSMMQSPNLGAQAQFLNPTDKSMMSTISRQGQPINSNTFDLGMNTDLSPIPESRVDLNVAANQNVGIDRPGIYDGINSQGMMQQGPNYTPQLGQSADYTGGGADSTPLYKKAYDKVAKYIDERPLEAALTGLTLGGALYEGVKPKQTQVPASPLGPQLGGKQFSGRDPILKVRRPR